jgi:hypothetical protein
MERTDVDRTVRRKTRDRLRLRVLLIIFAVLVFAWCPCLLGLPRADYHDLAESHMKTASSYRALAASPIKEHGLMFALGTDRVWRRIEWHLTAAEIATAKAEREQAARRAIYHNAWGSKCRRAAWFPWLPVEPDSLEPD